MNRKMYLSAPLPFMGQKRMFAKEFIKVLELFPDNTVFVDLFGGSGLLSHITKHKKPELILSKETHIFGGQKTTKRNTVIA